MLRKFGIPILAVALAIASSAFTAAKKEAVSARTTLYYWYNVDLGSQEIPQNAVPFAHAADVTNCSTVGSDIDCKRGFEEELDTSGGPTDDRGDVQKMTIDQ